MVSYSLNESMKTIFFFISVETEQISITINFHNIDINLNYTVCNKVKLDCYIFFLKSTHPPPLSLACSRSIQTIGLPILRGFIPTQVLHTENRWPAIIISDLPEQQRVGFEPTSAEILLNCRRVFLPLRYAATVDCYIHNV